jgi:hypothetical protein
MPLSSATVSSLSACGGGDDNKSAFALVFSPRVAACARALLEDEPGAEGAAAPGIVGAEGTKGACWLLAAESAAAAALEDALLTAGAPAFAPETAAAAVGVPAAEVLSTSTEAPLLERLGWFVQSHVNGCYKK